MASKDTSRKRTSRMGYFPSSSASLRPFRTAEDGATLVEFALTASILFMIMFGIIIMSFALYTYDFVGDAARMGTRYAIVRGSDCTGFSDCNANESQILSYLQSIPYPGIDPNKIKVKASWYTVQQFTGSPTTITRCSTSTPGVCNFPGNEVQVQVSYGFPLSIPFWKATTLSMSSTSQLGISQ